MFKKKVKKTEQELKEEREARLSAASDNLQTQLLKIEKMKQVYVQKAAEADKKGLTQQKKMARTMLGRCLAQEKQLNAMIMNIELAVQAKEFSNIGVMFAQCINDIAQDMTADNKKVDVKKTQEQITRIAYAQKEQSEKYDQMLDAGDYMLMDDTDVSGVTEYDEEIDAMIAAASEDMSSSSYNSGSYKNRR